MRRIILALAILVPAVAAADTRKLPITADVGICAHPKEVDRNTGANSRIRIKGNEHYYLFNFDPAPVRYWKITSATLHVKLAGGKLRRAAACTVPVAWTEGTGVNRDSKDETCYLRRRAPDSERTAPWTPGGGTMLDATFNSPYMMWSAADVKAGADGWLAIPLDARLVQAVAVGLSHGLVLAEDKGQSGGNHDIFTREQSNARPYLLVEGTPHHVAGGLERPPCKVRAYPAAGDFKSGAMLVDTTWPGRTDVLGSRVTVHQPIGTVGQRVAEYVTFADPRVVIEKLLPLKAGDWKWGVNVETYVGPQAFRSRSGWVAQSKPLAAPKVAQLEPAATMKRIFVSSNGWRVALYPAEAKIPHDLAEPTGPETMPVPVVARNSWLGLQAVVFPPGGKASDVMAYMFEFRFRGKVGANRADLARPTVAYVTRVWYVRQGKKWHGEVAAKPALRGGRDVPWKLNGVPGQRYLPLLLDVWVSAGAEPGPHEAEMIVQVGPDVLVRPMIKVIVADVTLPDEFHIVGSMNAYNSPAGAMGVKTSDPKAYLEMERKYYRLAHAHRLTLSVLPYSQSGSINWRGAPALAGRGADCRVTDWGPWDERYGPLLSGEAFTARHRYVGPGPGKPIHHLYLPLHENWPSQLAGHFKPWPPPKDYQAFLTWAADLPPIAKCIDKDFADGWGAVYRQLRRHVEQKGWTRTRYHVYLNNKYYFRNRAKGWGRGISLWLLDEPMFADDFLALRYFGDLTRRAGADGRSGEAPAFRCDYRIDISRPTHQRDWLDGVVDLNICADKLYDQRRLIRYRRERFGETYWNYRMPPSFGPDNAPWAAWPIRSYCWGATGTLPWQTIGSDGDLDKADATALMYPGRRLGFDGPIPSLRMKAWREGIQTAELLRMLRERAGWTDVQLRAWVGQVCGLDGWDKGMDPPADAPIVTFAGMTSERLAKLRRAALAALAAE